jgi:hypothetical protein
MDFRPAKLRHGAGNGNPADGLCLMQMVHWFSGSSHVSDKPACASPALCAVGIRLNDMATGAQRETLWPLVWQLLDSRDPSAEQARAEHIVREVAHRIVAPLFDARWPHHANALHTAQTMPEISCAAAAWAAAWAAWPAEARAARTAAWAAEARAAVAAAWAARAAEAAEAADATAWAAVAAARAAAWDELHTIFLEAIALGKHGEPDPAYEPRAHELHRIFLHANK